MDADSGQACDICWSVVPSALMSFHRIWHDDMEAASLRLFRTGELDETLQDMVSTVAAIKGVPQPRAGAEFVSSLREQLMAEALEMAVEDETAPRRTAGPSAAPPATPPGAVDERTWRLRRLARVAGVVAAGFVLILGTELVTHLRDTGVYESGGHPDTILPHPHPR